MCESADVRRLLVKKKPCVSCEVSEVLCEPSLQLAKSRRLAAQISLVVWFSNLGIAPSELKFTPKHTLNCDARCDHQSRRRLLVR